MGKVFCPTARRDGLLIEELRGEVVVYDTETQRAHCLNPTAALIWRRCDGKTTVEELARAVAQATEMPEDRDIVLDALGQLRAGNLLLEGGPVRAEADRTRRELIKRMGVLAAMLPVVLSISAPTPAMAQSGAGPTGPTGQTGDTGPTGPVDT